VSAQPGFTGAVGVWFGVLLVLVLPLLLLEAWGAAIDSSVQVITSTRTDI
jgi:hypothetical protein